MRRVVIESPFRGMPNAVGYARRALVDSLVRGEAPLASHLLYTQVLDDNDPEQRELGVEAGLVWQGVAEAVVVYGDHGMSQGMHLGVRNARRLSIPVEFRYLDPPGQFVTLNAAIDFIRAYAVRHDGSFTVHISVGQLDRPDDPKPYRVTITVVTEEGKR